MGVKGNKANSSTSSKKTIVESEQYVAGKLSTLFCSTEIRPPKAAHTLSGQGGLILVYKEVCSPPGCDLWQFGNSIGELNLY